MSKRPLPFVVIFILLGLVSFPLPAWADTDINITIDNNTLDFDVPPTIINGRTLVPLRVIFEGLGASVQWDSSTQNITGSRGNIIVDLQVGNRTASKNGQTLTLDVPATIISDRTMVPARFIAESLGAEVNWYESTHTVEINSNIPYGLTEYYILENNVKQLVSKLDDSFYRDLEMAIRNKFNPESYALLEAYLRRTYQPQQEANGSYIGSVDQDQGQGIYQWLSGSKYVGAWVNGNMEGKGAYYWPNGGKYIGEWQDNRRNGWGILYTSSGDIYVGEWVDDKMEGNGIYIWENGETYLGQWSNDRRNGLGSYSWEDGNVYQGQLANGSLSGQGTFIWYDGEQYLGEYLAGLKEGAGVYYWRPDFVFRGEYAKDNRTWGTYQGPQGQLLNLAANAQEIVNATIKPRFSSREKLKALHDYVVLQTSYDRDNSLTNTVPPEAHTAYGAFINHRAVCDGYAEALHSLLQAAGVPSIIVRGEAKADGAWQGHAWLLVEIDGKYSHVDVTWADPDQGNAIYYNYFLVSDEKMCLDHKWDATMYPASP